MMKIIKQCPVHKRLVRKDLDVTLDQIRRWEEGELIQSAMPHLSLEDREFLQTGMTAEVWEEVMGEEE